MQKWASTLIGIGVGIFVLWPLFIASPMRSIHMKKSKRHRRIVGCIPVKDGKIYMVNARNKHKFILPKGGVDGSVTGYYAAGKEALEEAGLIGNIDTEPIVTEFGIDWYMMEVTRVLDDWKERHERIRKKMSIEDVLLHSEVRATMKRVVKTAIHIEAQKEKPRLIVPENIVKINSTEGV